MTSKVKPQFENFIFTDEIYGQIVNQVNYFMFILFLLFSAVFL